MPTKAVVKKSNNEVPAYLKVSKDDLGIDSIGQEDIVIPRLKICQGPSKIKQVLEKIKEGQIYNSVTNEIHGNTISFWVLLHWKSLVWFSEDQKFMGMTYRDAKTKEEIRIGPCIDECNPDNAINSHNYFIILENKLKNAVAKGDFPMPIIYSASSSAAGCARQLNGKIKSSGLPIWGQLVSITTYAKQFQKGVAYMPNFTYGRMPDAKEAQHLLELHRKCRLLQQKAETEETIKGEFSQDVDTSFPPVDEEPKQKVKDHF